MQRPMNFWSTLLSYSLPSRFGLAYAIYSAYGPRRLRSCECTALKLTLAEFDGRRDFRVETRNVRTGETRRIYRVTAARPCKTPSVWKSVVPLACPPARPSPDRRSLQGSQLHCVFLSAVALGRRRHPSTALAARTDTEHENEKSCWGLNQAKGFSTTEPEYEPNFEEIIIGAVSDGKVLRVLVSEGEVVPKDAMLLRLEVGTVESLMRAPFRGTVASVTVRRGDKVTRGQPVIVMLPQPES